jgi:predicted RNA-binding Zn-ribbon protein involved in translation (DUF1610 family)
MAKICPECGAEKVHRSRSRGLTEPIRKSLTAKRIFRCHKCGWRGWLETGHTKSKLKQEDGGFNATTVLLIVGAVIVGICVLLYLAASGPAEG